MLSFGSPGFRVEQGSKTLASVGVWSRSIALSVFAIRLISFSLQTNRHCSLPI
ncbi:hypothetical protein M413DRAFT_446050 [Hebeloma cylindrosporum]|uniref:Uncharacterized protein n=1 Tax=Hebeloma cylindrosporum TaxID=76867 RepID=A0A0C3CAL5_HEBCY|nr:hypothetical protein M413DRAFT_446050 [Hebeloma cylindrosporum h7]